MPQEPKKRQSRARQGKRRAAIKLKKVNAVKCLNCQTLIMPHTICGNCGFYKSKQVKHKKEKTKKTE